MSTSPQTKSGAEAHLAEWKFLLDEQMLNKEKYIFTLIM
jgi:hypothetical protein